MARLDMDDMTTRQSLKTRIHRTQNPFEISVIKEEICKHVDFSTLQALRLVSLEWAGIGGRRMWFKNYFCVSNSSRTAGANLRSKIFLQSIQPKNIVKNIKIPYNEMLNWIRRKDPLMLQYLHDPQVKICLNLSQNLRPPTSGRHNQYNTYLDQRYRCELGMIESFQILADQPHDDPKVCINVCEMTVIWSDTFDQIFASSTCPMRLGFLRLASSLEKLCINFSWYFPTDIENYLFQIFDGILHFGNSTASFFLPPIWSNLTHLTLYLIDEPDHLQPIFQAFVVALQLENLKSLHLHENEKNPTPFTDQFFLQMVSPRDPLFNSFVSLQTSSVREVSVHPRFEDVLHFHKLSTTSQLVNCGSSFWPNLTSLTVRFATPQLDMRSLQEEVNAGMISQRGLEQLHLYLSWALWKELRYGIHGPEGPNRDLFPWKDVLYGPLSSWPCCGHGHDEVYLSLIDRNSDEFKDFKTQFTASDSDDRMGFVRNLFEKECRERWPSFQDLTIEQVQITTSVEVKKLLARLKLRPFRCFCGRLIIFDNSLNGRDSDLESLDERKFYETPSTWSDDEPEYPIMCKTRQKRMRKVQKRFCGGGRKVPRQKIDGMQFEWEFKFDFQLDCKP